MNLPIISHGRLLPQRRPSPQVRRHGNKLYLLMDNQPDLYRRLLENPQSSLTLGTTTYTVRARIVEDEAEAQCVMHLFRRSIATGKILRLDISDEKSLLSGISEVLTNLAGQSRKNE